MTTGKAAFLHCRGPCSTFLEPTALETLSGEILVLYHTERSYPTLDGVTLNSGKQLNIMQPARIRPGPGDTVLLLIPISKRGELVQIDSVVLGPGQVGRTCHALDTIQVNPIVVSHRSAFVSTDGIAHIVKV